MSAEKRTELLLTQGCACETLSEFFSIMSEKGSSWGFGFGKVINHSRVLCQKEAARRKTL